MIKLIIFDLDGTLLDTSGDICSVLNCSLKKFGLPELSLEKTMEYVGNGACRGHKLHFGFVGVPYGKAT